jgi:predicted NUDIX family NTP pyrophosphohydrolase
VPRKANAPSGKHASAGPPRATQSRRDRTRFARHLGANGDSGWTADAPAGLTPQPRRPVFPRMSRKTSAGLLLFRRVGRAPEFFLVHPGGPYWAKKDAGAWSIPNGEIDSGEDPLAAARREFAEETGVALGRHRDGEFIALAPLKQPSGKLVLAWALERDCDAAAIASNHCEIEWPPRSGRKLVIPEIDRAGWFAEKEALAKIQKGQAGFVAELAARLRTPRR